MIRFLPVSCATSRWRCTFLLLLLGLLAGRAPAWASHLVGGELTYTFLDAAGPASQPWRYYVKARIYCDQSLGSTSPNGPLTIPLTIYGKVPANRLVVSVNVQRDSFTDLTPPSPPGCLTAQPHVTLAVYDTIFSLPALPEGFVVQVASASRNGGISNLLAPVATGMVLTTDLTPGTLPNSSPEFISEAFLSGCAGQTLTALATAYDADGDRLSYQLAAPLGALDMTSAIPTGLPVSYAPGYSAAQPFGSGGQASIDATTGLSTFLSNRQGFFVLGLEVREYRLVKGQEQLLSTTRRDMQIAMLVCAGPSNSPPVFSAATLAQRQVQVEEGQVLQLTFTATDPDNQRLTMTVSSALLDGAGPIQATLNGQPGAPVGTRAVGVVQAVGSGTVTGVLRFIPGCGLARATPYEVAVLVRDEACASRPIAEVFRITVLRPRLLQRVQGDSAVCVGRTVTYAAVGPALGPYQWTVRGGQLLSAANGRTVQIRWLLPGTGRATVSSALAGGCRTDSVTQLVAIGSGPILTGPTTYCPRLPTDLHYTVAGPPLPYQWTVTGGTLLSGQGTNEAHLTLLDGASATIQVVNPAAPACPTRLSLVPDQSCLSFFTIITPNGDHQNDVFVIDNLRFHPQTALTIFNRWGRRLYYTADYQNTYDGDGTSAGLYYYLCQLADGTVYKGWFDLVR